MRLRALLIQLSLGIVCAEAAVMTKGQMLEALQVKGLVQTKSSI
jgi:hypothetical protein